MKSQELSLLNKLVTECGEQCGVCTSRDRKTIAARVSTEGLSFLTITLPSFAKGLERALARGMVLRTDFPGFGWSGRLPKFLSGFVEQVFARNDGSLLPSPSIDAIRNIRQICLVFSKIELPCSKERVDSAFAKFVETESELQASEEGFSYKSLISI